MDNMYFRRSASIMVDTHITSVGNLATFDHSRRLEKYCIPEFKSCFRCFLCGLVCSNRQRLHHHEIERHQIFRCSFGDCQQSFPHVNALMLHEETYHRHFRCSTCGIEVNGSAMITKHLSDHHCHKVPFVCICKNCNMFFPSPRDQAHHLQRTHPSCRKGTTVKNVMRRPERIGSVPNALTIDANPANERSPVYLPIGHHDYLQKFVEELINSAEEISPTTPEPPFAWRFGERNLYQFDHVD
jgi:hypothetical protein